MKMGSGPDLRDGEKLSRRGLPQGVEAYRQPDGQIALWDGHRHVMIAADGRGRKVALQMLSRFRS